MPKVKGGFNFPDDASDAEMNEFLQSHQQQAAPNPQTPMFAPPGQTNIGPVKADLPKDAPSKLADWGLSALPWLGAAGAVALGQPEMAIPAIGRMAAAGAGGALGSFGESVARKATGINPPANFDDAFRRGSVEGLLNAGTEGLASSIGFLGRKFNPTGLYHSALAPTGVAAGDVPDIVEAGLREKIPVGKGAAEIAQTRKAQVQQQISDLISSNPKDIPARDYVDEVRTRLDGLRNFWKNSPTDAPNAIAQIDEAEHSFLANHGGIPAFTLSDGTIVRPQDMTLAQLRQWARDMPTDKAQDIKKAAWEGLRSANERVWGPNAHPGIWRRAQEEIGGAMRSQLEDAYPPGTPGAGDGIQALNQRQQDLIRLQGAFEKREATGGNQRWSQYFAPMAIGGLLGSSGGPMGAGAGAAAALAATAAGRSILESPEGKSMLAIGMRNIGEFGPLGRAAAAVGTSPHTVPTAMKAAGYTAQGLLSGGAPLEDPIEKAKRLRGLLGQ